MSYNIIMRCFFGKFENESIILDGEELRHLSVLRLKSGENIKVFTNDEYEYLCSIVNINKNYAKCEILEKRQNAANPKKQITLFQALPKGEKLELVCQKATELGVCKIVPFNSEFSVAKNSYNKVERLKKIIYEACKQCGRSKLPVICDIIDVFDIKNNADDFDMILFANENNRHEKVDFSNCNNIAIIVGSEGGFSQKEIEFLQSFTKQIGLGERILRAETAAIALMAFVSLNLDV